MNTTPEPLSPAVAALIADDERMNDAPPKSYDFAALITAADEKNDDEPSFTVLRLSTSYWRSPRGLHIRRDLTTLKRLSTGYQILAEDAANIGVDEVITRIVNLDECKDGLYTASLCNEGYDWETGYLDSYDYCLTPYKPAPTPTPTATPPST